MTLNDEGDPHGAQDREPQDRQSHASSKSPKETSARTAPDAVEQKVVALAEQMGRLIGTVQARAEGWLDPQTCAINSHAFRTVRPICCRTWGTWNGKPAIRRPAPAGIAAAAAAARWTRRAEASSAAAINTASEALGRSRREAEGGESVDSPPAPGVNDWRLVAGAGDPSCMAGRGEPIPDSQLEHVNRESVKSPGFSRGLERRLRVRSDRRYPR